MNIFLICPVRNNPSAGEDYCKQLEKEGHQVYFPPRDTEQDDAIGHFICVQNRDAIERADEVHIVYDPESRGTLFDAGIAWAFRKKVKVANVINEKPGKSFYKMFGEWQRRGPD